MVPLRLLALTRSASIRLLTPDSRSLRVRLGGTRQMQIRKCRHLDHKVNREPGPAPELDTRLLLV
jgi:hypothetical protein